MTPQEIQDLIDQRLDERFRQMLAQLGGITPKQAAPETEWVDGVKAAKALGFPQVKTLYEAIASGLFRLSDAREAREVIDRRLPGRRKPRYLFHVGNCKARLMDRPEKRRPLPLKLSKRL
jgi:hypothetical protein